MLDLLRDEPLDPPADTAIAINVLEHIAEDRKALATLARSVVPGGTLVLFVPGSPSLYGPYDRAVGHVRRYTPSSLRALVESVGLAVEVLRPVNFLGGLAWWAAVRVGGCSAPRGSLVRIYDALVVPITSWIERRWTPPFGQSVFCVARVPGRLDPPTAS
jgi:SAM-dependent methyltransferase